MPDELRGADSNGRQLTRLDTQNRLASSQHLQTDGGLTVLKKKCSIADVVGQILDLESICAIGVDEEFLTKGRTVLMTVYAGPDREPAIQEINDEIEQVRIAGRIYNVYIDLDSSGPAFFGKVPVYAKGFAPDPDPETRISNFETFPQTGEEGIELVRKLVRDHHQNGDPNSLFRGDQFCLEDTLVEVTDSRPCRRYGESLGEFKLCPLETLSTLQDDRPGEWVSAQTLIHWKDENILSNPSAGSERATQ